MHSLGPTPTWQRWYTIHNFIYGPYTIINIYIIYIYTMCLCLAHVHLFDPACPALTHLTAGEYLSRGTQRLLWAARFTDLKNCSRLMFHYSESFPFKNLVHPKFHLFSLATMHTASLFGKPEGKDLEFGIEISKNLVVVIVMFEKVITYGLLRA